jgi:hypothetical protein
MNRFLWAAAVCAAFAPSSFAAAQQETQDIECGQYYSVVSGDTLSRISKRAYDSLLYQPIYSANVDVIGADPNVIQIDQRLIIPCLAPSGVITAGAETENAVVEGQLFFTFNKASAPPFIINSGIVDKYLAEIAEVTEGRVNFVDPETINRDHAQQFELVTSGQVDAAYVLNSHLAETHPLLQLPMMPMLGGSAEQTAVSLWRLHDEYLSKTNYFPEAQLLGFIAAPAAHIWRDSSMPVTANENIVRQNEYHVPYFQGLDTRGPAAMRAEVADFTSEYKTQNNKPPTFFLAHGAAIALGVWSENAAVSVVEVDNGLYTPTFSVILSNEAWAQISAADQASIRAVSGEALANRSAAWDTFDNSFRSRMLDLGLDSEKADQALVNELLIGSLLDLRAWSESASNLGIPANDALKGYLASLHSLKDRLIYRGDDLNIEDHPFVTGAF